MTKSERAKRIARARRITVTAADRRILKRHPEPHEQADQERAHNVAARFANSRGQHHSIVTAVRADICRVLEAKYNGHEWIDDVDIHTVF